MPRNYWPSILLTAFLVGSFNAAVALLILFLLRR